VCCSYIVREILSHIDIDLLHKLPVLIQFQVAADSKENTQRIESKHINMRTRIKRLVRRTICFSKTTTMHDLVVGLFINR